MILNSTVKRGRPAGTVKSTEPTVVRRKYFIDFTNEDATVDRWHYDLDKQVKGPYKTEMDIHNLIIPSSVEEDDVPHKKLRIAKSASSTVTIDKSSLVNNMSVKKTKRLYIHPKNGKTIGYTRARMLGLID